CLVFVLTRSDHRMTKWFLRFKQQRRGHALMGRADISFGADGGGINYSVGSGINYGYGIFGLLNHTWEIGRGYY
ncbi:hypothetical protein, partial [uncultured Shewanella sp.]|uniref:hypothetical protein n=1 Tax=uncultured Shewanella sp. TaxID=173975 RepID=UPI00260338DF